MNDDCIELAAVAAATAGAAVSVLSVALSGVRKKSQGKKPKYLRPAIPRPIRHYCNTPWKRLMTFGSTPDFIVSINITKKNLIDHVLPQAEQQRPHLNYGSPYRTGPKTRGRTPTIDTVDLMGLALWFIKSSDTPYKMCPIFGLVPSSIYVWLDYALELLLHVVSDENNTDFRVKWPSLSDMRHSAELLKRNRLNEPVLSGVFAVADGGRMPVATYTCPNLQNAYWEGFTQATEVTNLFVFDFTGVIIHAGINFPGSWHDSKVAAVSGLYWPRLSDTQTPPRFCVLVDSAFPRYQNDMYGKLVKSRKENKRSDFPFDSTLAAIDLLLERAMPSEHQSAEWGIRALKGPFKRLSVPLSADSRRRYRIIQICVDMYNFRVRRVGLNQLKNVYANIGDCVQPWLLDH